MLAKIQFKTKIRTVHYVDGTVAYQYVAVPELTRAHCDMAAFRRHEKYGGFANSDLFPNMLKRIRYDLMGGKACLRLDMVPTNASIDASGFLAVVTIEV